MAPSKGAQILGKKRMESMSDDDLRAFQSAAGKASAGKLTEEERKERASAAAKKRWANAKKAAAKKTKKGGTKEKG